MIPISTDENLIINAVEKVSKTVVNIASVQNGKGSVIKNISC